jgi:hypothetical protein
LETTRGFSAADVEKLAQLLAGRLRGGALPAPRPDEPEVAYTGRCIQPAVAAVIQRLSIIGILRAGDGAAPVRPVPFLGRFFYPDITVSYYDQPLVACEVKLVRDAGTQYALATAVGQVSIYRDAGYAQALLILIDLTGTLGDEAVRAATQGFEDAALLHLVVRQPDRGGLRPHPGLSRKAEG